MLHSVKLAQVSMISVVVVMVKMKIQRMLVLVVKVHIETQMEAVFPMMNISIYPNTTM